MFHKTESDIKHYLLSGSNNKGLLYIVSELVLHEQYEYWNYMCYVNRFPSCAVELVFTQYKVKQNFRYCRP